MGDFVKIKGHFMYISLQKEGYFFPLCFLQATEMCNNNGHLNPLIYIFLTQNDRPLCTILSTN